MPERIAVGGGIELFDAAVPPEQLHGAGALRRRRIGNRPDRLLAVRHQPLLSNRALSVLKAALSPSPSKRPSFSAAEARMRPPHATRARAPPTLTRRTPRAARSAS